MTCKYFINCAQDNGRGERGGEANKGMGDKTEAPISGKWHRSLNNKDCKTIRKSYEK